MRDIISRDLLGPTAQRTADEPDSAPEPQSAQPSSSHHIANELLSPLLKNEITLSIEPAIPSIKIDHDKLASLTRRTDT